MKQAGHVTRMKDRKGGYWVLFGRPDRKRPFERPRYRLEDNIKMDLQEMGWGGMDWIALAQDMDRWQVL